MPHVAEIVAENLEAVQNRIAQAATRCGRDPASVTLVAVTKYAQMEWIRALLDLGIRDLGENRPQQLSERAAELPGDIRWHLIGHLQRNKVRKVLPVVHRVHSLDSVRLIEAVAEAATASNLATTGYVEVNLSREPQKHGFSPAEITDRWPEICGLLKRQNSGQSSPVLQIRGLMTMAAETADEATTRTTFSELRSLRDALQSLQPETPLHELSMGMTGDFELAIAEGATLVRIGSALWQGLDR